MNDFPRVVVVGVGYVGLPLSCALSRAMSVTAYDRDRNKIENLRVGIDSSGSVSRTSLEQHSLTFTDNPSVLSEAQVIIVCVPTPVDDQYRPDLSALVGASETIGQRIKRGTVVVFESTVFPGATEEICIPVIERESGMVVGKDFQCGYSPERISPGDDAHTIRDVVKIIAAPDEGTLELMENIYATVTDAGVYRLKDIRTAEAAKIIENVQRDVNIALMNELAKVFHLMGIKTQDVLKAAGTKWNFGRYNPGLVGGHCIGVDPYYFSHKAVELGYKPEIVLSGRKINDAMGVYVARQAVNGIQVARKQIKGAKILLLGITYKENVPDTRNSLISVVINELVYHGIQVTIHDPLVDPRELIGDMAVETIDGDLPVSGDFDGLLLAVPHQGYMERSSSDYLQLLKNPRTATVVMDVKGVLEAEVFEDAGVIYWEL